MKHWPRTVAQPQCRRLQKPGNAGCFRLLGFRATYFTETKCVSPFFHVSAHPDAVSSPSLWWVWKPKYFVRWLRTHPTLSLLLDIFMWKRRGETCVIKELQGACPISKQVSAEMWLRDKRVFTSMSEPRSHLPAQTRNQRSQTVKWLRRRLSAGASPLSHFFFLHKPRAVVWLGLHLLSTYRPFAVLAYGSADWLDYSGLVWLSVSSHSSPRAKEQPLSET